MRICLIPFGNQEVPTGHVEETRRFLPLWKERLLEQSGASDAYFQDHFYVHSTYVSQVGDHEVLTVNYSFQVDWLTLLETTSTRIRRGMGNDYLDDEQIKERFWLNFTHPIEHITTRKEITASLDRHCAQGMCLVEENVRFTDEGRLTLSAWAEVDVKANKCKYATVDLESGEILSCQDSACWID